MTVGGLTDAEVAQRVAADWGARAGGDGSDSKRGAQWTVAGVETPA
jgi:hypothetical protein